MNDEKPSGRSPHQPDRRRRPTSPWDAFRLSGRRRWPRRHEERHGAFFVDRFDAVTFTVILGILVLTLVDGMLTIHLLEINCEEGNPFMGYLLTQGSMVFLLGKYAMTAVGVAFLVVYKNYPLFGSRFRAGNLLPIFLGLYLVLLCYQWALLRSVPVGPPAPGWPATFRSRQSARPGAPS